MKKREKDIEVIESEGLAREVDDNEIPSGDRLHFVSNPIHPS